MPVEFGIWKVGPKPEKIPLTGFGRERDLEDFLWSDISILDPELILKAKQMGEFVGKPSQVEHVVRIEWLKVFPKENAIWEPGMFANQNSACKLRNKFTLEKLIPAFGLEK